MINKFIISINTNLFIIMLPWGRLEKLPWCLLLAGGLKFAEKFPTGADVFNASQRCGRRLLKSVYDIVHLS